MCVQNIRVISCIADLWWRLSLAGLIRKSHRLGVLADCLSFQLFPYVKVCVCVLSINTESLRQSSVFTVAQCCKASAANLPRHHCALQPLLQAFLIYLLDFQVEKEYDVCQEREAEHDQVFPKQPKAG